MALFQKRKPRPKLDVNSNTALKLFKSYGSPTPSINGAARLNPLPELKIETILLQDILRLLVFSKMHYQNFRQKH